MVVVAVVVKGGGGVGEEVVDAASEGEESRECLPVATTRKKGVEEELLGVKRKGDTNDRKAAPVCD